MGEGQSFTRRSIVDFALEATAAGNRDHVVETIVADVSGERGSDSFAGDEPPVPQKKRSSMEEMRSSIDMINFPEIQVQVEDFHTRRRSSVQPFATVHTGA